MSAHQASAVEVQVDLDLDQELILIRRFEDAVASLVEEGAGLGAATPFAHQEFERSWRIATNMRGHIR